MPNIFFFFLFSKNNQINIQQYYNQTLSCRNISGFNCEPSSRIVFLKTHKTASTTVAGIFANYAYNHDLNVAYPEHGAAFHVRKPFVREQVRKTTTNSTNWDRELDGFDLLSSHARYNRHELEVVVPKAKYITIIREPVAQFKSSFEYFGFSKFFNESIKAQESPIDVFFRNPKQNLEKIRGEAYLHNQQIFDLGLESQFFNDPVQIDAHIRKLDKEFDLVLINEYLDASLLLMGKILCWNHSVLFYHNEKINKHKIDVLPGTVGKIKQWNMADYRLYDHFNQTFWQKVSEYGKGFKHDLLDFQMQNQKHRFTKQDLHNSLRSDIIRQMSKRGIIYDE